MSDEVDVAAGGEKVADVAELLGRAGVFRPIELGEDQVLFADDPRGEVLDFNALATTESFVYAPNCGIFVPPSHSLVFETTGAVSSDARIMFYIGGGWGYRTLQNILS